MTPEEVETVKELTNVWVMRQERLVNKKLLTEDPVVVYSAAISTAVHVMVSMIMKFDVNEHRRMMNDMGTMIVHQYNIKMQESQQDQPRIIVAH
jgi:hypothetical protein